MKQFFRVLICNLVVLFALFCCAEFSVSWYEINHNFINKSGDKITFSNRIKTYFNILGRYYFEQNLAGLGFEKEFRAPAFGKNADGESIIISGCSFAAGEAIEYKDTFGVVLAEDYDKYSVYNIGVSGGSAKQGLYIFKNYDLYAKKNMLPIDKDKTKYVIYTYISDQSIRLIADVYRLAPCFKIKKDKNGEEYLEFYKSKNILRKTFLYHLFFRKIRDYGLFQKQKSELFTLYMKQMKKEVIKNCPNAEFILFMWDADENIDIKTLMQIGIKVVKLKDISSEDFSKIKYKASDEKHPNGIAWRIIVPLLMKELEK